MTPQIIEDDHSEVSEISCFKQNDDAVKPSNPPQNIDRPVLQSWEGNEYLEHEVAAVCFSSLSIPTSLAHSDFIVRPSTPWPFESPQNRRSQHGRIRSDDSEEEIIITTHNIDRSGKAKGKRDCNPNSRNDFKRKQFSDWLQSQPDAHDDWGFTSTGCTPVCLSRCSSAVNIVTADGQSAGK